MAIVGTVEIDPLCGESHPIKQSQGGKEFYYCGPSHSTIWLTNPMVKRRVLNASTGRTNSNPTSSSESGRPPPYPCPKCNEPIEEGESPCRNCGEDIQWVEGGARTNPVGGRARTQAERVGVICRACGFANQRGSQNCGSCGQVLEV